MGKKANKINSCLRKKNPGLQFPFHCQCLLLEIHQLGSGVQAGATNRRPTTEREKKKIIMEVYGQEKTIVRAALSKKKYRSMFTQPLLPSRCRFRCFAGRGLMRHQNFLATIHPQSFTFKEGLGRHILLTACRLTATWISLAIWRTCISKPCRIEW